MLKRFFTQGEYHGKISTRVNFPVQGLDLTPWLADGVSPSHIPPPATFPTPHSHHPTHSILPQSHHQNADDVLYDLRAVSNHTGSLSSGHYTATVKSCVTGTWHTYNDKTVTELCGSEAAQTEGAVAKALNSSAAYVLVYQRRHHETDEQAGAFASALAAYHARLVDKGDAAMEVVLSKAAMAATASTSPGSSKAKGAGAGAGSGSGSTAAAAEDVETTDEGTMSRMLSAITSFLPSTGGDA